ncbi:CoA pyrophosphatase [Methylonatrum kenyense]|uniref:CoA pyrophosphatase n=1 Tax=Methylonatrum kenyense TaxID=455253 RepID=UPI0020C076A5|nr:CoA pyrophosphatase [Methylonatrum kenyense]MCK8516424.1 CoA pyrophosphatase [Methylonatrum kenyense]
MDELSPEVQLRQRLMLAGEVSPRSPFALDWSGAREAAVLLAVMQREAGSTVLLTRRSDELPHHAGQISLPGGRVEAGDKSVVDTALREAMEEVGLAANRVETLGHFGPFQTGTGFIVHTVLGLVAEPPLLTPDPREVADVVELPLAVALDPCAYQPHLLRRGERTYSGFAIDFEGHRIWGATACILRCLMESTLRAER